MARCKDCIHNIVCSALIEKGLPWDDGEYPAEAFCITFRNKSDIVPKSEVDKARLNGYESGKREVVREIYTALYNEIIDARNSNFEAIKERETKHNVNRYEDTFCKYCDGKIHALDGIAYFITELTKKYMGGQNNQ